MVFVQPDVEICKFVITSFSVLLFTISTRLMIDAPGAHIPQSMLGVTASMIVGFEGIVPFVGMTAGPYVPYAHMVKIEPSSTVMSIRAIVFVVSFVLIHLIFYFTITFSKTSCLMFGISSCSASIWSCSLCFSCCKFVS